VGPGKLKPGFSVIKGYTRPSGFIVAGFTACLRIIPGLNKALVNILVTVPAIDPYRSEAPFFLFFVAFGTGCCLVSPLEGKGTLAVLFKGV
jgi:hypothetical protein